MTEYIQNFIKSLTPFWGENTYKKDDDAILFPEEEDNESLSILMDEQTPEQVTQEFIQQTLDYFKEALENSRPLTYVSDLRFGLARTGDGIESEILWWAPLDHPVGAMLNQNPEIKPMGVIEVRKHGKMSIYSDADVRLCVEEISNMLLVYRSIKLISGQEKEQDTSPNGMLKKD